LVALIKQVNRRPVERDTLYNVIRDYSDIDNTTLLQENSLN